MKSREHTTPSTPETSHRYLTDEEVEALAQQNDTTPETVRLAEQIALTVHAPAADKPAHVTTGCQSLDVLLDGLDAHGLAGALVCLRAAFINNRLGDAVRESLESRLRAYLDGSDFTYSEDIERAKSWLTLLDGLVAADRN